MIFLIVFYEINHRANERIDVHSIFTIICMYRISPFLPAFL